MDQDDLFRQQWDKSDPAPPKTTIQNNEESTDHWFVPHYTVAKNLQAQIETIELDSSTSLVYRQEFERIDIWGSYEGIQRAKQSLDHFAKFYLEIEERKQREKRTKGWAKPDRELTPSEKKKLARQEKRIQEAQRYLGKPPSTCAYNHLISWPKDLTVYRLLGGEKMHVLTPLRNEFQCYIWMERQLLHIAGDNKEKTYSAMNRIKNFLLRRFKSVNENVTHILEQPYNLVRIKLADRPLVQYIPPPILKTEGGPAKFIAATEIAKSATLREYDLQIGDRTLASNKAPGQAATSGSKNDDHYEAMKYHDRMVDSNIRRIGEAVESALEDVQPVDGDIKMRICLGQVALRAHPIAESWDVRYFDSNVIPDGRLASDFSPFFTKDANRFEALKKKLTPQGLSEREPEMLWTLGVLRRDLETNIPVEVQLDVTFREPVDDQWNHGLKDNNKKLEFWSVALWNALVQKKTPLDVRVISADRLFSWSWVINSGRRLDSDKFSPEGKFVHELQLEKRRGEDPMLIYANTNDVQLRQVKREKKWQFSRDQWTIELTEDTFWRFENPTKPDQKLTLGAEPILKAYSISMQRDSWTLRLCENPHLGLGQLPSWEPSDFLKEDEAIPKTLEAVAEMRSIVEKIFQE